MNLPAKILWASGLVLSTFACAIILILIFPASETFVLGAFSTMLIFWAMQAGQKARKEKLEARRKEEATPEALADAEAERIWLERVRNSKAPPS